MNTSHPTSTTITIDINTANQRFDRFLRKFYKPYTQVTLAMIYEWIRKGYIRVNEKKAKEDKKLLLGDRISIQIEKTIPLHKQKNTPSKEQATAQVDMIKSNIIYEDDNRLVFNKPPHILMHPGSGASQKAITMNDWLYTYINLTGATKEAITKGSIFKPAFCFRLDKTTSGVLIAAKQYEALQYLNALIKNRETTKWYIVVVQGKLPKVLDINKPLFKGFHAEKGRAHMFVNYEKGLASRTKIYGLEHTKHPVLGDISLGLVHLYTGRMHQIRVHVASEGHPVLGDIDYGTDALTRIASRQGITRQLLHSFLYTFNDKNGKSLEFIAKIPKDITTLFPQIVEKNIIQQIHTSL